MEAFICIRRVGQIEIRTVIDKAAFKARRGMHIKTESLGRKRGVAD